MSQEEQKQTEEQISPQETKEEKDFDPKKVLFSWQAYSRPFKRRSREYYVRLISIFILFGIILFAIDGILPVLLLGAAFFLLYALGNVEPDRIEYQVTPQGIRIHEHITDWLSMGAFWFTNRIGAELLVITIDRMPGRMELVINENDKEKLKKIMDDYLPYLEQSPYWYDNTMEWISRKVLRA